MNIENYFLLNYLLLNNWDFRKIGMSIKGQQYVRHQYKLSFLSLCLSTHNCNIKELNENLHEQLYPWGY